MGVCIQAPEHALNEEYLFRCLDDADRTVFISFTLEALTNVPVKTYFEDLLVERRGEFLAQAILNEVTSYFQETKTKTSNGSTTYRIDRSVLQQKEEVIRYLRVKKDDWERIQTAVEQLHTDEVIDVLHTLGDSVAEQEDVNEIPREDLESFVMCGWPDHRSDLLRALEPNGMIGKYLHTTFPLPPAWKERSLLENDDFTTYFETYVWPLGEYLASATPAMREDWNRRLFDKSKTEWQDYQAETDEDTVYSHITEHMFDWFEEWLQEIKDIPRDYPSLRAIADTLSEPHRRLIYLTYGFETGDPAGATTLIREYCSSCTSDDIMEAYLAFFTEIIQTSS